MSRTTDRWRSRSSSWSGESGVLSGIGPCRSLVAHGPSTPKGPSSQTTMAVTGHLAQVTTSRPGSRARTVGPDQTIGSVRTQSARSRTTFIKARSLPSTVDGITAGQRHYWSNRRRSGSPRNGTRRTDRLIHS
jgi:hypothetical protein